MSKKRNTSLIVTIAFVGALIFTFFILVPTFESPSLNDGSTLTTQVDRAKLTVTVARSESSIVNGLAGRAPLGDDQGMYFVYDQPQIPTFWMRGVSFPIDIIWVRGDTVTEVTPNVPPPAKDATEADLPRYRPSAPVDRVLEVAAGWAARNNIQPGDPVRLRR